MRKRVPPTHTSSKRPRASRPRLLARVNWRGTGANSPFPFSNSVIVRIPQAFNRWQSWFQVLFVALVLLGLVSLLGWMPATGITSLLSLAYNLCTNALQAISSVLNVLPSWDPISGHGTAWIPRLTLFSYAYSINNLILLVYSLNLFFLLLISVQYWNKRAADSTQMPAEYPNVLVQLPIYNERYLVDRLIRAAIALDYPRDRLLIQVLDDSTDDTATLAQACVDYYQARGHPIEYVHRSNRNGYKAGALAAGLANAPGEFVAIFDADFIPPPDFLLRMIPDLLADPQLGMIQARWEHTNPNQNLITQALALGFDAFFTVEQVARSQARFFMNFNGSAGIWRRRCIEESGGWHADTLVEDTDLSYRAQLRGWRFAYRPDVGVPAQLPDTILALKLQQFRWSKGATQALLKLGPCILASNKSWLSKLEGLLQLSGYLTQPLMLLSLLLSLPVVLLHGMVPLRWAPLGAASIIAPLVATWGQVRLQRNFFKVWLSYPVLFLSGIGLSASNTHAIIEAFFGRKSEFKRTPKVAGAGAGKSDYRLLRDWTILAELALALYGTIVGILALKLAPDFAPFIWLYAAGFGFTAILGLTQKA